MYLQIGFFWLISILQWWCYMFIVHSYTCCTHIWTDDHKYNSSTYLILSSFASFVVNVFCPLCLNIGVIMIGSEKFGGNSCPSGGSRENVGGDICRSFTSIGVDIRAMLCSMLRFESEIEVKKSF